MSEEEVLKKGMIDACKEVMNDTSDDRDGALDKVMGNFAKVIIAAIKRAVANG